MTSRGKIIGASIIVIVLVVTAILIFVVWKPFQKKSPCSAGHGTATDGNKKCKCNDGWRGDKCEIDIRCEGNICSGHGTCLEGNCTCIPGWRGTKCEFPITADCPNNCNNHGRCISGVCQCNPGYTGTKCETETSGSTHCEEITCNGHGKCYQGKCFCKGGYNGGQCEFSPKPDDVNYISYGDIVYISYVDTGNVMTAPDTGASTVTVSPLENKLNKKWIILNFDGSDARKQAITYQSIISLLPVSSLDSIPSFLSATITNTSDVCGNKAALIAATAEKNMIPSTLFKIFMRPILESIPWQNSLVKFIFPLPLSLLRQRQIVWVYVYPML
jgi:hypothetical protein